jgi:hypothetical protein
VGVTSPPGRSRRGSGAARWWRLWMTRCAIAPDSPRSPAMSTSILTNMSGPLTRADIYAAGVGDAQLRQLLHDRVLLSFRRGTYVRAVEYWAAEPPEQHALEIQSLVLSMSRQNVVAASYSAARIHGIDLLHTPPDKLYVVTDDPAVANRSRDGYVLRVARLPADDVCRRYCTRATAPARTVIDLACDLDFREAVVAMDSALHQDLTNKPELSAAFGRLARKPGIEAARKVAEFGDGCVESPLESVTRVVFHEFGLPAPRLQVWLSSDIRVDKFWPIGSFGVVGEDDGLGKFIDGGPVRTREYVRLEAERDAKLEAMGYEVLHFSWTDLADPARLVARVREALARAEARCR